MDTSAWADFLNGYPTGRSASGDGTIRSTIDCVIAAIAEENGCYLLARDRDMDTVLKSGLVGANPWPISPTQR